MRRIKLCPCLSLLLALLLVWGIAGQAAAREQLTVNWSPNLYVLGEGVPAGWLENGGRERITTAITRKLHALRDAGELPFDLRESSSDRDFQQQELGPVLSLVPVAVLGTAADTSYYNELEEKKLYKTVVLSGLSLFVCSVNEEVKETAEGLGSVLSYRVLGMLPLYGHVVLGDKQKPLLSPVTEQDKREAYLRQTVAEINNGLEFAGQRNICKNLSTKQLYAEDLSQVTGVDITSRLGMELFGSDGEAEHLKNAIAYFYTGAYQQRTKRLVMLPLTGNMAVHEDIVGNAYSFSLDSPSGKIDLSVTRPKQQIHLNLYGVAKGLLPQRYKGAGVMQYMMYQVWLRKSPQESGERTEMTMKDLKVLPGITTEHVQREDKDIFLEMIVALAQQLGSQKK